MRSTVNRRGFLKTSSVVGFGIGWGNLYVGSLSTADASTGMSWAKKLGWRLACAAYTFWPSPFDKTLDWVADLGFESIEGLDGQPLSEDKRDVRFGYMASLADRNDVKKRLEDKRVRMVGSFLGLPPADDCRKVFDWAKEMGLEYLAAEPPFDDYETLDKLCQEYQIKLAIHNHADPTPDLLAEHLRGCSHWMGACPDTGHWVRRGLNPVEMMKTLQGHILTFHLKDIATVGTPGAGCVPFGTGKGNIEGILREAYRQKFQGVFTIEYEPYSPQSYAQLAECIASFETMAKNLATT